MTKITLIGDIICDKDMIKYSKKNNYNFNDMFLPLKDYFKSSDYVISNIDSTIGNSKIKITDFDVKYQYELSYKFKNLNSIETLSPVFSGNTDKALLKITTTYSFDSNSTTKTLQGLLNRYGYIEYVIGDKTYRLDTEFKEIKSVKAKLANTYFYEVDSVIMKADKIILGFRLRNSDYKYYLKGSV